MAIRLSSPSRFYHIHHVFLFISSPSTRPSFYPLPTILPTRRHYTLPPSHFPLYTQLLHFHLVLPLSSHPSSHYAQLPVLCEERARLRVLL